MKEKDVFFRVPYCFVLSLVPSSSGSESMHSYIESNNEQLCYMQAEEFRQETEIIKWHHKFLLKKKKTAFYTYSSPIYYYTLKNKPLFVKT